MSRALYFLFSLFFLFIVHVFCAGSRILSYRLAENVTMFSFDFQARIIFVICYLCPQFVFDWLLRAAHTCAGSSTPSYKRGKFVFTILFIGSYLFIVFAFVIVTQQLLCLICYQPLLPTLLFLFNQLFFLLSSPFLFTFVTTSATSVNLFNHSCLYN